MKPIAPDTADLIVRVTGVHRPLAAALRRAACVTLQRHRVVQGVLDIAVVSTPEMKKLHARWMNDPAPTDVLTFDLRDRPRAKNALRRVDGQIVVCRSFAASEARRRGLTLREELLRYVVHGCLHLVGYDDRRKADADRMTREQERLMERLAAHPTLRDASPRPRPGRRR
jgi:probable rRNA maturation factor